MRRPVLSTGFFSIGYETSSPTNGRRHALSLAFPF